MREDTERLDRIMGADEVPTAIKERAQKAVTAVFESISSFMNRRERGSERLDALQVETALAEGKLDREMRAIQDVATEALRSGKEVSEQQLDEWLLASRLKPFGKIIDVAKQQVQEYLAEFPKELEAGARGGRRWIQEFMMGLPEKKKTRFETKDGSVSDIIWNHARNEVLDLAEQLKSSTFLPPLDIPAFLMQRFHFKPAERNEIIWASFEGRTKQEQLAKMIARLQSSEHLTEAEIIAATKAIEQLSDEELVGADLELNSEAERELSEEFIRQVEEVLKRHLTTRIDGKMVFLTTSAMLGTLMIGPTTKMALLFKDPKFSMEVLRRAGMEKVLKYIFTPIKVGV